MSRSELPVAARAAGRPRAACRYAAGIVSGTALRCDGRAWHWRPRASRVVYGNSLDGNLV